MFISQGESPEPGHNGCVCTQVDVHLTREILRLPHKTSSPVYLLARQYHPDENVWFGTGLTSRKISPTCPFFILSLICHMPMPASLVISQQNLHRWHFAEAQYMQGLCSIFRCKARKRCSHRNTIIV